MRLTNRVHRLEAASGAGICPECGGKGILCVSPHAEGEPAPIPKGCPVCGKAMHVIIEFRDENLPGRSVKTGCTLTGQEMWDLYT